MGLKELQAFYASVMLPDEPIKYKQGETITDPVKFVETQLSALLMPPHTRFYQNALMRLGELMDHLNNIETTCILKTNQPLEP